MKTQEDGQRLDGKGPRLMRTITLPRAEKLDTRDPVDPARINITGEPLGPMPRDAGSEHWSDYHKRQYRDKADQLLQVLVGHCPGGLIDQLTIALLEHQASVLKVSYKNPDAKLENS